MRMSSFVMTRRYRKACEKITLVFVCSGWKDWRWSNAHVSVGFLYIVLSNWPICGSNLRGLGAAGELIHD